MSGISGKISTEQEKLELEVKELKEKLSDVERPIWKQSGFPYLIIPVVTTLLVSVLTLGYQVYKENFSELAKVELAEGQEQRLIAPLQRAQLELTNDQLRLTNTKLEFETQEKKGSSNISYGEC